MSEAVTYFLAIIIAFIIDVAIVRWGWEALAPTLKLPLLTFGQYMWLVVIAKSATSSNRMPKKEDSK